MRVASARLGVPTGLVEKDYWITQVLRTLTQRHYGQFILKGGTSLSKGWRLIDRFSEDVDLLLVTGQSDHHDSFVADLIDQMRSTVREVADTIEDGRGDDGVMAVLHVSYPAVETPAAGLDDTIRIDYGVGGGSMPQEDVVVSSLLAEVLQDAGQQIGQFEDLAAFQLTVLHPARTLIEKMILVHNIAVRLTAGGGHMRSREARHYYDLYHLLDQDRSPALAWIWERTDIGPVIEDCLRVTREFYDGVEDPPRPLSSSAAFHDATVLNIVAARYDKMVRELAFPGRSHPSLDDVLSRVHDSGL